MILCLRGVRPCWKLEGCVYSSPFLVASLAADTATHATTDGVAFGKAGVVAALRTGRCLCALLLAQPRMNATPRTAAAAPVTALKGKSVVACKRKYTSQSARWNGNEHY